MIFAFHDSWEKEELLKPTKPQPVKIDLNKKLDPKQKTIQPPHTAAQGFRKARNVNPPTREIGVTMCRPICPWLVDQPALFSW